MAYIPGEELGSDNDDELIEEALEELGYAIVNVLEDGQYEEKIDDIMDDLEKAEERDRKENLEKAYRKMDGSVWMDYRAWPVGQDAEEHLDNAYEAIEKAKELLEDD